MSAISATLAGRSAAERLMLDAGTAKRPSGGYEYVDGKDVQAADPLFDSRCKIQTRMVQEKAVEVGARTATVLRVELHLPADTAPLTVGDLFTVTTPHALSTVPAGRTYRVLAPFEKGLATARRYDVEVVL